jgi:hypothetical protein
VEQREDEKDISKKKEKMKRIKLTLYEEPNSLPNGANNATCLQTHI